MTFSNSVLNDFSEKNLCFYINDSRKVQLSGLFQIQLGSE
jgi:hypothetical protein